MNDTFVRNEKYGGLAQLARAPALQAGGQRFESVILHYCENLRIGDRKEPIIKILHKKIFDILTQAKTVSNEL